jgi:hypothetical protein
MAITRNHRFPMDFEDAFPQGLVLVGEIGPDNEYQENQNRPPKQRVDEQTGLLIWKGTVTDPDEVKAKRASFELYFLAKHRPVPATQEVLPGMRPIELDGLTAQPKVAGNGEYKYLSFVFRATGIRQPQTAGKQAPKPAGSGDVAGKAA